MFPFVLQSDRSGASEGGLSRPPSGMARPLNMIGAIRTTIPVELRLNCLYGGDASFPPPKSRSKTAHAMICEGPFESFGPRRMRDSST